MANIQQLGRFYSGASRNKLIEELFTTEKIISDSDVSIELKALYKRRYMRILDVLKERLENFDLKNLNEKAS
ncbi:MAG TPA: hypothetical protein P5556_07235 [Candidatus Gastranaerophilales bacterium]|nr:hypothetical protein [Candidatus Gastranaerophilales bacterium]